MKLLQLISSSNPSGGGPIESIKLSAPIFKALGVDTELTCCDPEDAVWLKGLPLVVHALGPAYGNYNYSPRLYPWLKRNAHRFDAVLVHGLWQYHGLAVHRALSNSNTPYFVFPHGMLDPWFRYHYPLKHLKKWIYWPWGEYRILRDARAVIFTCEEERILARQSFGLYRVNEVVTAYGTSPHLSNGAELAARFLVEHTHLAGKRLLLFLSRIHEKKGCDMLIEAFAQVASNDGSLHLLMVGPDQTGLVAKLQRFAERIGVSDRITWTGMLQGDDKWGAYYASEVFCLPSHQENFGIVVAEALACSKPVLISNKVNIWREIQASSAGFVDEDTVAGTVSNLNQWLTLDQPARDAMGVRAFQCFQANFHIQRAVEQLTEILKGHMD